MSVISRGDVPVTYMLSYSFLILWQGPKARPPSSDLSTYSFDISSTLRHRTSRSSCSSCHLYDRSSGYLDISVLVPIWVLGTTSSRLDTTSQRTLLDPKSFPWLCFRDSVPIGLLKLSISCLVSVCLCACVCCDVHSAFCNYPNCAKSHRFRLFPPCAPRHPPIWFPTLISLQEGAFASKAHRRQNCSDPK